jgi:hypothetical protein
MTLFCGLFYDAVSSKTAQLHGLIEVLSWHLPGENNENHENLRQDGRCPGQDLNKHLLNTSHTVLLLDQSTW